MGKMLHYVWRKRGGGSKTRFMVILFRKISLISFSFLVPCLHCFSGFWCWLNERLLSISCEWQIISNDFTTYKVGRLFNLHDLTHPGSPLPSLVTELVELREFALGQTAAELGVKVVKGELFLKLPPPQLGREQLFVWRHHGDVFLWSLAKVQNVSKLPIPLSFINKLRNFLSATKCGLRLPQNLFQTNEQGSDC